MRKQSILAVVCILLSWAIASGQTHRRGSTKRASRTSTTQSAPADLAAARKQVALQLKALMQFLYVFGGVVKGIDCVEQTARTEEPPQSALDLSERNKTKVKESIKNVRDGLDKLDSDFRSNPGLSRYYLYISGVALRGETAETQAEADHFDEAGRLLLRVVDQLTDALALMR